MKTIHKHLIPSIILILLLGNSNLLSAQFLLPYYSYIEQLYGYKNAETNAIVIPPTYEEADDYYDGFAKVMKGGKYGFIDVNNKELIPLIYTTALSFAEKFAAVEQHNRWGFCDVNGKIIIPLKYEVVSSFVDGIAVFRSNSKYGFIDIYGKEVIPAKYQIARQFSEGLAAVRINNQWQYISPKGMTTIQQTYEIANRFQEGLAAVRQNGRFGFIDTEGNKVIDFVYERAENFNEGLACVYKNGKYGYINPQGVDVIPPQFDNASSFNEGLAAIQSNGKWGFIDNTGATVIPVKYDEAQRFSNGATEVRIRNKVEYIFHPNPQNGIEKRIISITDANNRALKQALAKFMVKDEYETQNEYNQRVARVNARETELQNMLKEEKVKVEKRVTNSFANTFIQLTDWTKYTIGTYDAEQETFPIRIDDRFLIRVKVPRKDARVFKETGTLTVNYPIISFTSPELTITSCIITHSDIKGEFKPEVVKAK